MSSTTQYYNQHQPQMMEWPVCLPHTLPTTSLLQSKRFFLKKLGNLTASRCHPVSHDDRHHSVSQSQQISYCGNIFVSTPQLCCALSLVHSAIKPPTHTTSSAAVHCRTTNNNGPWEQKPVTVKNARAHLPTQLLCCRTCCLAVFPHHTLQLGWLITTA